MLAITFVNKGGKHTLSTGKRKTHVEFLAWEASIFISSLLVCESCNLEK